MNPSSMERFSQHLKQITKFFLLLYPEWLMPTSFSSYFLSRLTFVQFGIHLVVSSYAWFILFYFVLLSLYTFSSCSSHSVNRFYSKFLHPEFGSRCCKYTLTESPASTMHMHTPSTANAFWGHNIEDEDRTRYELRNPPPLYIYILTVLSRVDFLQPQRVGGRPSHRVRRLHGH